MQAKCLYDFVAQHPGELNCQSGEALTVLRQDIGEGWCEAKNKLGRSGLIPQSYLKIIYTENPLNLPPPPLPSIYSNLAEMFASSPQTVVSSLPDTNAILKSTVTAFDPYGIKDLTLTDSFNNRNNNSPSNNVNVINPKSLAEFPFPDSQIISDASSYVQKQEWDSDWDDDEEEEEVYAQPMSNIGNDDIFQQGPQLSLSSYNTNPGKKSNMGRMTSAAPESGGAKLRRSLSEISSDNVKGATTLMPGGVGTFKRNLNRFSLFNSGVEPYIMGLSKTVADKFPCSIEIIGTGIQVCYMPLAENRLYTCTISSPQKESKLKGLKSFIAYQLICSNSGIKISRRYKHFDWLHERLEEKFTLVSIPPLPGKQVTGRYEEEFIEHRMNQLQMWVNRICRHPVLSQCQVWQHFITCTDMKQWKEGKRRAEKDPLIGPELFNSIKTPIQALDHEQIENQMQKFSKFIKKLDYTVTVLTNHIGDLPKKILSPSASYFDFLLIQFNNIAKAFEMDERSDLSTLIRGVQTMCEGSHIQWESFYNKYKNNLMLIQDMLYEYKGFLSNFSHILNNHRSALNCVKEYQRTYESNSDAINYATLPEYRKITAVVRRMNVITYHTLAEMNYFRAECLKDFKVIIKLILQTFLDYLNQISLHITKAITAFDSL